MSQNPDKDKKPPPIEAFLTSLEDMQAEADADAKALHYAWKNNIPRGPMTTFDYLDREMGGHFAPGVHMLLGEPATGKSAWCLQVAATCGFPALYVTCEMSRLELHKRNAARVTNTPLGRFKSGEQEPTLQSSLLLRSARQTPNLKLLDATVAPAPPEFIRDCALIVRGQSPHMLVVVDSLHSWVEGWGGEVTEYEALNVGIKALRTIAHQIQHPVLCISERNRETMKGKSMSGGAGTRKIEYGAETVFAMTHGGDNPGTPDGEGNLAVDIKITKNRHGAAGKEAHLTFNGKFQRFQERRF